MNDNDELFHGSLSVNPSRPRVTALHIGWRGRVYTTRGDISMARDVGCNGPCHSVPSPACGGGTGRGNGRTSVCCAPPPPPPPPSRGGGRAGSPPARAPNQLPSP